MIKETINLIILDRSGSMSSIRSQAIAGVNETFGTIAAIRRDNPKMKQTVSFVSFCSCEMRKHFDRVDVEEVRPITARDYEPCCCTPLYDAIGQTCTDLKRRIGSNAGETAVSVTIITDGYENASREWTRQSVKALIESLKAEGWLFAYIGANQDVEQVKYDLAISNTLAFEADEEGVKEMFAKERRARKCYAERLSIMPSSCCMAEDAEDYFKE